MIETTTSSVVYTADGSQTQWTIPFSYGHAEDVKLFVKIGTADIAPVASNLYSVDTELNTITYPLSGDPLAANDKVIVMRVTEQTQEESSAMLSFKSEDIERMADKLTMEVQELQEQLSRCIAFNPVDAAEGELDAQQYIDDLTELKDTATTQATIATTKAGEAATSATASEASKVKSQKWAEGSDADVTALGGTHSAKGWATQAGEYANSEKITTVANNIANINTVAGIDSDVTTVSGIHSHVTTVATHINNIDTVASDTTNIDTVAESITDVNTVSAQASAVATVAGISSDVTTVATNVSDVSAVADDIAKVTAVADDLSNIDAVKSNLTEINAVNDNKTNINAVAANATNINTVAADKTNIDAVAGNATNINTVATNASAVSTVATNISDVSAVSSNLTDISAVADDLTNINTVAASLPDIQDKQNKVLTTPVVIDGEEKTTVEQAIDTLNDEWVKPADWIDIRSAALKNSIYFLVGHAADYSSYRKFSLTPTISSGTYDVYIDGTKYTTAESDATTTLDWQTLALQTGWDVTYPEALRTHIVRITPTTASSTITHIVHEVIDGQSTQGTLWIHFSINNAISVENFCYKNGTSCPLLEAVTTTKGELEVSAYLSHSFGHCSSLLELPKIRRDNPSSYTATSLAFANCEKLRKLELEDINMTQSYSVFQNCYELKEIKVKNCTFGNSYGSHFTNCYALRRIPDIIASNTMADFDGQNMRSLGPTVIDLSVNENIRGVHLQGSSTYPARGIRGLIVCSTAPFTSTAATQINVSYTGMDRAALVALFNSMPTVSAGQICVIRGATGANDLTAEDIAVVTQKGWTLTR